MNCDADLRSLSRSIYDVSELAAFSPNGQVFKLYQSLEAVCPWEGCAPVPVGSLQQNSVNIELAHLKRDRMAPLSGLPQHTDPDGEKKKKGPKT